MVWRPWFFVFALFASGTAMAQPVPSAPSAINPADWRGEIAGQPSRILTIGSAHLSQLTPRPAPALLEALLTRLVAFAPDIITYEGMPGEQCEALRTTPALFDNAAATYCWDAAPVTAATGISEPQARMRVAQVLASWPTSPTAAQRRQLATLFLAANDRPSALVQWLQLPVEERRAGDGLTAELLPILQDLTTRINENYAIAAVVAARRGLVRVYPVDDHSADAVLAAAPPQCTDAITTMWQSPAAAAQHAQEAARIAALSDPQAMLGYYRHMNHPDTQRAFMDVDHRAAVGRGGAGECGRRYVAWWETRNLRMAANIRAAMGSRPGARVLNIVGASHKPYYDLYLGQMADAVIVDAGTVLGED